MAPLLLTLGRGVVTGLGKHPSAAADLPGERLTRRSVRVDPARVAAYARVCGFPPGAPGLPLTYPHILGFPLAARLMAARAFPLPLLGLVHTSVAIHSHHPLTPADRPDLSVRATTLRPHHRGTEVTLLTEAHLDGTLAWRDTSTYLARHRVPDQAPITPGRADGLPGRGPGTSGGARGHDGGAPDGGDRVPGCGPDGADGLPSPTADGGELPFVAEWVLGAGLGRRHARVSGDYNPIHLYALTARPLGFPRAIVHGMWTVARCTAEHPDATGVTADFRRPVLLPSTVDYAARGDRFEVRSGNHLHVTGHVTRTPGG